MIEMAEQFSRNEVISVQERLDQKEEGLMVDLIRRAGELGFCGVDSPEAYGGLGLGKNLAARILEHLSLNASFSVTIGVTSGIGQLGISLFGTHEQKSQYLPKLTSGEAIGAYALSEPDSGTDALSLATTAKRQGDTWVLNGTKMWTSNAAWADVFLVIAKVDGSQLAAFIVERNFPGVSISREEHKLGVTGSSTARLIFDDAQIPQENLLFEPGKGHHVALNALNLGRFKLGAMALGPAREAIWQSSQYAQERKQFGQTIASFGLVKQKFADMAALYFAAESCLFRTGHNIDGAFERFAGDVPGNMKAAREFAIECSIVKVLASEVQAMIADEALQVFGGYGFSEEFPLARIYRDARVSKIYEGTNEINRIFIAEHGQRAVKGGKPPGDSFIGELLAQALSKPVDQQVALGALADLMILSFAEQSTRLRADRLRGMAEMASDRFANWANARAGYAFQVIMGEEVTLPKPRPGRVQELSDAIFETRKPILQRSL